jgi:hypothetical protein
MRNNLAGSQNELSALVKTPADRAALPLGTLKFGIEPATSVMHRQVQNPTATIETGGKSDSGAGQMMMRGFLAKK